MFNRVAAAAGLLCICVFNYSSYIRLWRGVSGEHGGAGRGELDVKMQQTGDFPFADFKQT